MAKAMFITKGGEYFPPLGIMQISATAKKAGHKIVIGILSKDIWEKIEEEKPEVIAYSGSTGEHILYFKFNRELKKRHPKIKTIMGGPHATFFPEKTLEDAIIDAVCIGEGDYSFPEFLNRVDKNRDFSNLENIMVQKQVERPKLKPLIEDLNSLIFPDRELFYNNGESGESPIKHFLASRGCQYSCTYCFNDGFKKMYSGQRYVRKRSVENIVEEIEEVRKKWPLKHIKFYDDVFTLKADDWLEEFSEKYKKRIDLPFFCLTRASLMSKEMIDLLEKAGCKTIGMSIESANPKIRNEILNRKMTNEQIKEAYKLCGEKNITIQSNNILGLPTSTIEDDINTVDFNIECGPKQNTIVMAEFGTAHPYPGTKLGDYCQRNGLYDSEKGFYDMHMSYHDESPLNCFTPMEKRMQKNLTMLGTVAVRFPKTRNLIVNHLIKLPNNPLYFAAFYITKTTGYMKYIYPAVNQTWRDYLKVIKQSLKLDWFKRMGGKKWRGKNGKKRDRCP